MKTNLGGIRINTFNKDSNAILRAFITAVVPV